MAISNETLVNFTLCNNYLVKNNKSNENNKNNVNSNNDLLVRLHNIALANKFDVYYKKLEANYYKGRRFKKNDRKNYFYIENEYQENEYCNKKMNFEEISIKLKMF